MKFKKNFIKELISLANHLDQKGMLHQANILDKEILKLSKTNQDKQKFISWEDKKNNFKYLVPEFDKGEQDETHFTELLVAGKSYSLPIITVQLFQLNKVKSTIQVKPNQKEYKDVISDGLNKVQNKRDARYLKSILAILDEQSTSSEELIPEENQPSQTLNDQSTEEYYSSPTIETRQNQNISTNRPTFSTGNKALIYGNSIAGGLGLAFKSALEGIGYNVKVDYHEGYNDSRLFSTAKTIEGGPWDHVVLFVGGNAGVPTPGPINNLIDFFGKDKTTIILMPVNLDDLGEGKDKNGKNKRGSEMLSVNQANQAAISLPSYWAEGKMGDFTSDKIHMKPGSPAASRLVSQVMPTIPRPAK
jgi:hypothetical protein